MLPPFIFPGRVSHRPGDWWRYAAGEVCPKLRYFLFRRRHRDSNAHNGLAGLVEEARKSRAYVEEYSDHLVQALSGELRALAAAGEWLLPCVEDIQRAFLTDSDQADRVKREATWPTTRIAILRLVAMRRIATALRNYLVTILLNTSYNNKCERAI